MGGVLAVQNLPTIDLALTHYLTFAHRLALTRYPEPTYLPSTQHLPTIETWRHGGMQV